MRHVAIALIGIGFGAMVQTQTPHRSTAEALSFASAYAGFGLLVAALAVGPLNLLRGRPNPVSTDLRRDIGIWCALFGVAHTVAGLNVHMHGHMVRYFITSGNADLGTKAFIAANWLGLLAVLVLLTLLSISNDFALRALGTRKWKLLQQTTYVAITAIVLHGAVYQILEKRRWLLALILSVLALAVGVFQSAGIRARQSRNSARAER